MRGYGLCRTVREVRFEEMVICFAGIENTIRFLLSRNTYNEVLASVSATASAYSLLVHAKESLSYYK